MAGEAGEVSTGDYVDAHVPAADASAGAGGGVGGGDGGAGGGRGVGGHPPPTHLLLLVHGLHGTPEDFDAITACLSSRPRRGAPPGAPPPLIHATRVNHRRTADGVAAGGRRVAADVCALAAAHPSLTHLSVVGFSLGGLYARYAIAALYDPRSGRLASGRLTPHTFVAVASPMLGVRCFGLMRFLPAFLQAGATVLFGATGSELMLQDRQAGVGLPTLLAMTTDRSGGSGGGGSVGGGGAADGATDMDLPFLSALRAFSRRSLFANFSNDAMVAFGTATLETAVCRLFPLGTYERPPSATFIHTHKDAFGGRPWFSFTYPPTEERGGRGIGSGGNGNGNGSASDTPALPETPAGVGAAATPPSLTVVDALAELPPLTVGDAVRRPPLAVGAAATTAATVPAAAAAAAIAAPPAVAATPTPGGGTADAASSPSPPPPGVGAPVGSRAEERLMAARLRSVGWTVTVVDFGMPLPFAHNRIIALNRNRLQAWLNAPGRPAVELLVDQLVEGVGGWGGGEHGVSSHSPLH
ncbi:hypothetical protein MMPV_007518 [Pyropia vietnamensis]